MSQFRTYGATAQELALMVQATSTSVYLISLPKLPEILDVQDCGGMQSAFLLLENREERL